MSERDPAAEDGVFSAIIDRETVNDLDAGIRIFDEALRESADYLNREKTIDPSEISDALEILNAEWEFNGEVASISGRIYLESKSIAGGVPAAWGERFVDPAGQSYFLVDQAEVVSIGIVADDAGVKSAQAHDGTEKTRLGYGFSMKDGSLKHDLTLYPGEAARHMYSRPSHDAIRSRLALEHPDLIARIDALVNANDREVYKLPKRLERLGRRIDGELRTSPELIEWVALYIEERIGFDRRWPIAMTLQGQLTHIDVGGVSKTLHIDEPHTEYTYQPRLSFVQSAEDGAYEPVFDARISHPIDENYVDRIIVPMRTVIGLRNTRRAVSLVDRALSAQFERVEDHTAVDARQEDGHQATHLDSLRLEREVPAKFFAYDAYLKQIVTDIRSLQRISEFDTMDTAQEASTALSKAIDTYISGLSVHDVPVVLRGKGVSVPNVRLDLLADASGVTIQSDNEVPYGEPHPTHEYIGYYLGVHAGVDVLSSDSGDRYAPMPQLIFNVGSMPIQMVRNPVPLVEMNIHKRATVRIDTHNSLRVAQVEVLDDYKHAHRAFKVNHPQSTLLKTINQLGRSEAALSVDKTGFTPMKDVSMFARLADEVEQDETAGADALEVVSKLYHKATARVKGQVWHDGEWRGSALVPGEITAFIPHVPGDASTGVALVMSAVSTHTFGDIYYLPLRTLTQFEY